MTKQFNQLVAIVSLSLLLGIGRYIFLEEDYPLFKSIKIESNVSIEDKSAEYIKEFLLNAEEPTLIDINFAKKVFDQNIGIFIDARDVEDYNTGHVKNAVNIPFDVDNNYNSILIDSLMTEVSFNEKALIVYCSGDGCTLGKDLVYYLYEELDFYSLFYFEEGYPVWKDSNFPVGVVESIEKEMSPTQLSFEYTALDMILLITFFAILLLYSIKSLRKYLYVFARCILGVIFIYFSYDKIIDPLTFAKLASNYDIIPYNLEYFGALILPWLEMIVGICLILGVFIEVSASLALSLLMFFIFMLAQAYLRGKSIDCGCLLADLNNESSLEKRAFMIKRIVQDLYFLCLNLIIIYKHKFIDEDI